jgi:hypothetical protein
MCILQGCFALSGGIQFESRCFLALLDKAVQQYHRASGYCEQYARNGVVQVDPGFPKSFVQLSDQRHAQRPSDLDRHDLGADHSHVFARQSDEPVANGLVACFCAVEAGVQSW